MTVLTVTIIPKSLSQLAKSKLINVVTGDYQSQYLKTNITMAKLDDQSNAIAVDVSNTISEYNFPLFVYADMTVCCVDDEYTAGNYDPKSKMKKYGIVFGDYLSQHASSLSYTSSDSNRVNYRLTMSIPVRTYYFRLSSKEFIGGCYREDDNIYSVTADCEDECCCCYSKNCHEMNHYIYGTNDCSLPIPTDHVCDASECECNIYYGDKWHVYIGDFMPIIKVNGSKDSKLEELFSRYNDNSSATFNNMTVENTEAALRLMSPLQGVLSILLFRPVTNVGNDK